MTRMLVVVRSNEDAAAALAGGADGLVLRVGAAPDRAAIEAVAQAAAGRCPIALWLSEAPADLPGIIERCRPDTVWTPFDMSGPVSEISPLPHAEDPAQRASRSTHGLASFDTPPAAAGQDEGRRGIRTGFAAVIPFDAAREEAAFAAAAGQGFAGVIIGDGVEPRRLLAVATIGNLQQQVGWARIHGLASGIAGAMEMPDIPRLAALRPDSLVLGDLVRRDAVASASVDPERVRHARALVPDAAPSAIHRASPDRIFVRDWTVSIPIGAYAHERARQRVRFTVEAEVVRTAARAADLRDVVTYDLITDAIARATTGHVDLVETVADDVAASVLAHPRVMTVDVTVEKLDLGPGALGCRIVRSRDGAG